MAYCVHCGVKLGDSEQRCPLCNTVVLDPSQPRDPHAPRAYPVRTPEQELKRSKRFWLHLCALLLLVPAILCLLIDLLPGSGLSWSIYPSGALIMLFISCLVLIFLPRHKVYTSLGVNFIALSGYLRMVEQVSQSGNWFFPIVFPSLALATAILAHLVIAYRHQVLNKLTALAASMAWIGVECLAVETLCCLQAGQPLSFQWSVYVAAPCIFLCLALFYINSNRTLREEMRRRLHY